MESFLLDPTTTSLARMQAFLLVFFRITGFAIRAPLYSGTSIPFQVRIWVSFLFALIVYGVILQSQTTPVMPQSPGVFLMAAGVEFGLGLLMGFLAGLILSGLQLGGRLIDDQMGFSMANVVDPTTNEMISITGQIVFLCGVLLFLVMGGLNHLIEIVVQSFQIVPLLAFDLNDAVVWHILTETMPQTFVLAVAVAAPAICVVLLSTVGLGLIGKVVPEMNIFAFSFGIRVFLGLIMLWMTAKFMPFISELIMEGTLYHIRYTLEAIAGA